LQTWGIPTHTAPVVCLEGDKATRQVDHIRLAGDQIVSCDAVFFNIGTTPASTFHEQLGCRVEEDTQLVWVDENQQTSVPGVFAAGDLTPYSQLAVVAAAQGAMAAIHMHKALNGD
jgi:thioredoxin reductase